MAIPYHTHRFEIPTATRSDVASGNRTDVAVVPASLGTAASRDAGDFATKEQGSKADTALQPGDIGSDIMGPIGQFVDNGFPNHQTDKSYNQGSYVRYVTGGGARIYRSKVANNTALPTDTNNWERISDLAFLETSGTPTDTTFLRGDGQWASSTTLIYGPDNFVVTSGEFPPDGRNVVYAMKGPNAATDPDSRYWYSLGDMASRQNVSRSDLNIDGPPETPGRANALSSDGTGTLFWYSIGTVSTRDFNNNPNQFLNGNGDWVTRGNVGELNTNGNANQFLNGQGNWSNIPTPPQAQGYWHGLQGNPFEDENIYVRISGATPAGLTTFGVNIKQNGGFGFGQNNNEQFRGYQLRVSQGITLYGLNYIHFYTLNSHYTLDSSGIFVDKRSTMDQNL